MNSAHSTTELPRSTPRPFEVETAQTINGRYRAARSALTPRDEPWFIEALDVTRGRAVLLRMLAGNVHPAAAARIAKRTATIVHPNIATVLGHGQHDGRGFVVHDFFQGVVLQERVGDRRFSVGDTIEILKQLVDALMAGRRQGVGHGGLNPGCIMLARRGSSRDHVTLCDFGLALADPQDPRVDIFGVGAVGYAMVMGERFVGNFDRDAFIRAIPVTTEREQVCATRLGKVIASCVATRHNRFRALVDLDQALLDTTTKARTDKAKRVAVTTVPGGLKTSRARKRPSNVRPTGTSHPSAEVRDTLDAVAGRHALLAIDPRKLTAPKPQAAPAPAPAPPAETAEPAATPAVGMWVMAALLVAAAIAITVVGLGIGG